MTFHYSDAGTYLCINRKCLGSARALTERRVPGVVI